jgi:hypothetical protein
MCGDHAWDLGALSTGVGFLSVSGGDLDVITKATGVVSPAFFGPFTRMEA